MVRFLKRFPYPIAVFFGELIYVILLSGALLSIALYTKSEVFSLLNYDTVQQTLVALNSGILIAIFVALFYGKEENITIFKKFKNASRQKIIILVVNSVVICFAALFAINYQEKSVPSAGDFLLWSNIISLSAASVLTIMNTKEVYKLVRISLRKDNSDKLPK